VVRFYNRGVKYYESLRVVYEIETRLKEWAEEQPQQQSTQQPTQQTSPAGETK
jgi:hypothetical protein